MKAEQTDFLLRDIDYAIAAVSDRKIPRQNLAAIFERVRDALPALLSAVEGAEKAESESRLLRELLREILSNPSEDWRDAAWTEDGFYLTPKDIAMRKARAALSSSPTTE